MRRWVGHEHVLFLTPDLEWSDKHASASHLHHMPTRCRRLLGWTLEGLLASSTMRGEYPRGSRDMDNYELP